VEGLEELFVLAQGVLVGELRGVAHHDAVATRQRTAGLGFDSDDVGAAPLVPHQPLDAADDVDGFLGRHVGHGHGDVAGHTVIDDDIDISVVGNGGQSRLHG